MNIFSLVSTVTTVLSFLAFLGIVAWAYSKRRASAFEEAANAPFALPDDGVDGEFPAKRNSAERQS
jgi:cytochrome c oxidase cbb3-type subunit 4